MFDKKAYMKIYNQREEVIRCKKQWFTDHPNYKSVYNKQWRDSHKKKQEEYAEKMKLRYPDYYKKYYLYNKEKIQEHQKQYREKYPEKRVESDKKYRKTHKEEIIKRIKRFFKTPKGKAISQRGSSKRRTNLKEVTNTLTVKEWLNILEEHNYVCAYCGVEFDCENLPTRDHVIPISRGGHNIKENIVPACKSCNSRKGTKILKGEKEDDTNWNGTRLLLGY